MNHGWRHVDTPPFFFLQGLVSCNALLLTVAVLIRQNRMAQVAEHRAHLDLQINMLTEQKVTKVLELVDSAQREIKNIRGAPAEAPREQMNEMTKPADPHAILEAFKLGQRAAKVGFDWPDVNGLFDKLAEESAELRAELDQAPTPAIEDELGDVLFTAINLARHLHLEPEFALRKANRKFRERFNAMESAAGGIETLQASSPDELEDRWREAKLSLSESGEA